MQLIFSHTESYGVKSLHELEGNGVSHVFELAWISVCRAAARFFHFPGFCLLCYIGNSDLSCSSDRRLARRDDGTLRQKMANREQMASVIGRGWAADL